MEFTTDNLSSEDAFWVMWYFLQEHYELSENTFDVSDILSASQPMDWNGSGIKKPADNSMIDFWNDALEKYKRNGIPDWKKLKK
jgi:hypothetical protein